MQQQLDELAETELSAASAAALEAAVHAAGALAEVAGPGGVLPSLPLFMKLLQTLVQSVSF